MVTMGTLRDGGRVRDHPEVELGNLFRGHNTSEAEFIYSCWEIRLARYIGTTVQRTLNA